MMEKINIYQRVVKRLLDIVLSALALILLCPVLILICILILIDDFGPILFKQKRIGKNERIFEVLKFRTMCVDAEKHQKIGVEIIGKDPRITKIGFLLRRFKIDELPQLINVLKGDMSIIGPRPPIPDYLKSYQNWERERFRVRPGLSGLAQVNGNIFLSKIEKSKFDIEYVHKISFLLDTKIVLKTVLVIIFGEEKFKK